MIRSKKKKKNKNFDLNKLSVKATTWIGSTESLVAHTALFILAFLLGLTGVNWDRVLLVLTTIVSLEAIYLAIFIQMTVNRNTASLEEVEEGIEEIQADVDIIQEDVDEMQHNVDEIQHDVDEIEKQEEEADDITVTTLETIKKQIDFLTQSIDELKRK